MQALIRRTVHAAIGVFAGALWLLAFILGAACVGCGRLMRRVWPDAEMGNCYSHALPRWADDGGYLVLMPVPDNKFFWFVPLVHAVWLKTWPSDAHMEMTKPVKRRSGRFFPLHTFYFRFRVVTRLGALRRDAPDADNQ